MPSSANMGSKSGVGIIISLPWLGPLVRLQCNANSKRAQTTQGCNPKPVIVSFVSFVAEDCVINLIGMQEEKVLLVSLGNDLYAIPIAAVEEVLPALPIEPVPRCPRSVRGVIFVRGHLIPVLDAAEQLGCENHQRLDEPNIVCL